MDQIETVSQGWWRPSPGSIYPLLEDLSVQGIIKKRDDGRYEITEKGRQELLWTPFGNISGMPRTTEEVIAEMESNSSYLEDKIRVEKPNISNYVERLQNIRNRIDKIIQQK